MTSLVKDIHGGGGQILKGTVVLMQKNVSNFNPVSAAKSFSPLIGNVICASTGDDSDECIVDTTTTFLSSSLALKLISATRADGNGKGKVGKKTFLKGPLTSIPTLKEKQFAFSIHFEWDHNMGIPGAFYIENFTHDEVFLVSLTLEDVSNHGTINFVCNSWVYNAQKYKSERIFFANKTYLPSETPSPLVHYIQEELKTLRGDGSGERKEWDRIYDYDVYNDLGQPDRHATLARPVLGGSTTLPYPRRGRTGRELIGRDPKTESRSDYFYIPRDELLGHVESSDFLVDVFKRLSQNAKSQLLSLKRLGMFKNDQSEFNTFQDVLSLFYGESNKSPLPKVIEVDHSAWMTDEEFAREMIAGVNPNVITKLLEFPPKSKVDSQLYGDNTTTITKEHLEPNMDGVNVEQAIQNNRLYILDHHDPLFPYLRKLSATGAKAYASRTILFLQNDGTLKPLAIELSTPHPEGDSFGPVSNVYLPATEGVEASIWLLAKAYVVVNDSCYHQLISHWLNTHAVVEPFIIATNRQLSVVHPIHKLLLPHYRNTMNINAGARKILISAGGIIESAYLLGNYTMEMSAAVYKDWVFTDQGLPNDLIKRGVAVEDPSAPYGVRLLIEDYPYASDGLEIWAAIKSWVEEYVNFYYKSDATIAHDSELQAFWKELVEVGHGDLKNATWWFKMQTRNELIEACTILIWIASTLHASVNFGQYPYGGYIVNRPTKSRRFMPEKGSPEYDELAKDYEKVYLSTITPKNGALLNMTMLELLSTHVSDEQYLGHRIEGDIWTFDSQPIEAYKKFGTKLAEIERKLIERNNDESLRNRYGPVKMPYTILYPSNEAGLTFRGIPNSISI
ncbi:linoleate 9S-lipoxygenase-like [Vicia villosa]|uniref:linoleate 9S-lipoxygenase-like n=1 Tax=Vicia villosa TaxID=3911 RepID=UPI00273C3BEB|nr:linoleate 9S-lipoxygenase-like [Vicia villosa]